MTYRWCLFSCVVNIIFVSTIFNTTKAFHLSLHTLQWINASNYCESYCNSNLASIHSREEHLKTVNLINNNAYVFERIWLGLNDIERSDIWKWSDGSEFSFGNLRYQQSNKIIKGSYPWRADEPDYNDPFDQCVALDNVIDEWIDRPPNYFYHFLCNDCSGIINKYVAIEGDFNYLEAEQLCADKFGTTLASIHNDEDMIEAISISKQLTSKKGCWIGLKDSAYYNASVKRGNYAFSDGTNWDYGTQFGIYPWYKSEPRMYRIMEEYCIYMDPQDYESGEYLWDDYDCNNKLKALCNAPSEICNSNQWETIKGNENKWIWNKSPCSMIKSIIETDSIIILPNKQYININGNLIIHMMYSINNINYNYNGSASAGIVLYLNKTNNENCDNYYYVGINWQESIIFIGKYINNIFHLIRYTNINPIFNLNIQYLLTIKLINGTQWNVLFNKQLMITIFDNEFDNENNLFSGYIGIKNVQTSIDIRSLYISGSIQYENNTWYHQCATISPTNNPTISPTIKPSYTPTTFTIYPTKNPSLSPITKKPSLNPTNMPTISPITKKPSLSPTNIPTISPTNMPTISPTTKKPSLSPTKIPSLNPTNLPTINPTNIPTIFPTNFPTINPTNIPIKPLATNNPSQHTIESLTYNPSISSTVNPIENIPIIRPTKKPSLSHTNVPSNIPSNIPTINSISESPTNKPSNGPIKLTNEPTKYPSVYPSHSPSIRPIFFIESIPIVKETEKTLQSHEIVIILVGVIFGIAIWTCIIFYIVKKKFGFTLQITEILPGEETNEINTYLD